jgi:23S rRNA pseudouridine2604 synthase
MNRPPNPGAAPVEVGERLAKRVAALRGCSRAEAERLIEGGWVRVDGVVVEQPQHRVRDERIEIDPNAQAAALRPMTLLLHRSAAAAAAPPAAADRWDADPSRERLLRRHLQALQAPLSLPPACSGLVVWTQDAAVARRLMEDATLLEQEFQLDVAGTVSPAQCEALQQALPGGKASVGSSQADRTRLRVVGKGALAPAALLDASARAGLAILALKRLRIGRIALGPLPEGRWRFLRPFERF